MEDKIKMPEYVKRLNKERDELHERTEKLIKLIGSKKFDELNELQKRYLILQSSIMLSYEHILELRLRLEMAEQLGANQLAATKSKTDKQK